MACRGVFFALGPADEKKILDARSNDELVAVIQEDLEERWDAEWLAEVDKSWDAMQRCLGDGTLGAVKPPLAKVVVGGRWLYEGPDYIVSFLTAAEVKALAAEMAGIDRDWFARRYATLGETDYEGPIGDDDFEYTWAYFTETRGLFERAASDGRAMIFTVDQ